ncbi:Flp family type IVb pilin [Candidatus Liberibacter asiaticus]
MNIIKKILKNGSGATAIEYGLLASLVSVAIISAVSTLGDRMKGVYQTISTELDKGDVPPTKPGSVPMQPESSNPSTRLQPPAKPTSIPVKTKSSKKSPKRIQSPAKNKKSYVKPNKSS